MARATSDQTDQPLAGRHLVLGVTGGIAAYKAADLASQLVQLGATVEVILTAGAQEFVRPLTFSAITRQPVHVDPYAPWSSDRAGHVTLAATADALIVAPATANAIARLSLGLADDVLGIVALATLAPLVIAPAMEHHMWHHPATMEHVSRLRGRGATVVGPEAGRLASGAAGDGRLAATAFVVGAIRQVLGRSGRLAGKRIVITSGGTQEPIDPVRFLGNRSSGLMGLALAAAAIDHGAEVTLIVGPMTTPVPFGATVVPVETAVDMYAAVAAATTAADVLIMAAAVADFRPGAVSGRKVKKRDAGPTWSLELVQNPDILASITRPGLLKVGFAAETEDLEANAAAKLRDKGLAMIIANDAVATIGQLDTTATLLSAGRPPEKLPTMSKAALAEIIVERVAQLLIDSEPSQGHV